MSFDKECAITMMIVGTITLVCCGILMYRNHQLQDKVFDLTVQLDQIQAYQEQHHHVE